MNKVLIPVILIIFSLVISVNADSLSTGGPYLVGDLITINGDTNFNTDNKVLVEVYPASFGPTSKFEPTMTGGSSIIVPVVKSDAGMYSWSANMSSADWSPDQYMVRVEMIGKDFVETSVISLTEKEISNTTMNKTETEGNFTQFEDIKSAQEDLNQSSDKNETQVGNPE